MNLKSILNYAWRKKWVLLIGGLIVCVAYLVIGSFVFSNQVHVSLVYPGAENGLYPDGQRILRNDLIETDRINEALAEMQQKGWYTDYTAETVRSQLTIKEYLSNPVQEKVDKLLTEGMEYTYYNNEFIITFTQPLKLHLTDPSDLFGLLRRDCTKEFLEALLRADTKELISQHSEEGIFIDFANYMEVNNEDYRGFINAYTDKALLCENYLVKKKNEDATFVSESTNLSFDDLITAYESLTNVQIERLNKFTFSEKVCRSLTETVNLYKVEIENCNLTKLKAQDEYTISHSAMLEYDHTFSENIIIVAVNEDDGLYQARPKTAYDSMTQRALNAGVRASNSENTATDYQRLIDDYIMSMTGSPSEVQRKLNAAEEMKEAIIAEYDRLVQLTSDTISDFLLKKNQGYMESTMVEKTLSLGKVIKIGMAFCFGILIAWLVSSYTDHKHTKSKKSKKERKAETA